MKKKNVMVLSLVSLLSINGCLFDNKESNSESESERESELVFSESESEQESFDLFNCVPEEIKNYKGNIDMLVYIEGQNGTMEDIGNKNKYDTWQKIPYYEMGKFVGSARAFKEVCPGVKINLIYCSINEYNDTLVAYSQQKGHLPQLIWSVDRVCELIQNGYIMDLSKFKDTEYYQSFDDYYMSRFNFGGFQGAIPFLAEPWGVFVNQDALDSYAIVNTSNDNEYRNYVDNFTWEEFVDTCKRTTDESHSGLSKVWPRLVSYSCSDIYDSYVKNNSVSLSDNQDIATLLAYEDELCDYAAYEYDGEGSVGNTSKEKHNGIVYNWYGNRNFVQDEAFTFYTDAPWAVATLSQWIDKQNLDTRIDYLPYPKVNDNSAANIGIAVEGLAVGNLCPIGEDGKENCYSTTAKLEQDVAAYYAMFMSSDYRAIKERSLVEFTYSDDKVLGSLSLPMIKKDFHFSWEDNKDITDELGDYYEGYSTDFDFQLAKFFELYHNFLTDNNKPDIDNYSNIKYGMTKILDSMYGDNRSCINYANEPVNIPDGSATKNIFKEWEDRQETYYLGSQNYVSDVLSHLSDMEDEINEGAELAWNLLQEMCDLFYEEEKYDVLDHSSRNNY